MNPVRLPSVTIRCEMLPNTSMAPASPHIAPLSARASVIVRLTGMPAYLEASRESPTARMRNPSPVRNSRKYTATATTTATTTPRWSWVPCTMIGSHACFDSRRVWGISPVTANGVVLSTSGPGQQVVHHLHRDEVEHDRAQDLVDVEVGLEEAGYRPPGRAADGAGQQHQRDQDEPRQIGAARGRWPCPASPPMAIWPSPPMLRTLARKAMQMPTPTSRSGTALTAVLASA